MSRIERIDQFSIFVSYYSTTTEQYHSNLPDQFAGISATRLDKLHTHQLSFTRTLAADLTMVHQTRPRLNRHARRALPVLVPVALVKLELPFHNLPRIRQATTTPTASSTMKTGAIVAAAATALAAIIAPTQVVADECSTLTLVVTFLPLLTDANTCASNTGYTLYPFTGLPTAEELTLICADTTCTKVLAEAAALDLPDCTVTYNGVAYNIKDEITLYATACGVARK